MSRYHFSCNCSIILSKSLFEILCVLNLSLYLSINIWSYFSLDFCFGISGNFRIKCVERMCSKVLGTIVVDAYFSHKILLGELEQNVEVVFIKQVANNGANCVQSLLFVITWLTLTLIVTWTR